MTAEIGVLNKSAVALAADSAVTISSTERNGRKVYNTANKIFSLSRTQPVGIMIYNKASLGSIPWETIIKMYRKYLGEKSFTSIAIYKNNFIQFLRKNIFLFSKKIQISQAREVCYGVFDIIQSDSESALYANFTPDEWEAMAISDKKQTYYEIIIGNIKEHIDRTNAKDDLETFNVDHEKFMTHYKKHFTSWIKQFQEANSIEFNPEDLILSQQLLFNFFIKEVFVESYSGIVIVGFGEKQIYPQLINIIFGAVVCDNIRYKVEGNVKISDESEASIIPFAQRDMIDTFMQGIDPELNDTINGLLEKIFEKYNSQVAAKLSGDGEFNETYSTLSNISSKVLEFFINEFQSMREEMHINPILSSLGTLSKEDLAELAESLINLTYLKRRISFDEESVGGPVDVAIITKGDGFIWVKRKHYFKPEKNFHYLAQILKNS